MLWVFLSFIPYYKFKKYNHYNLINIKKKLWMSKSSLAHVSQESLAHVRKVIEIIYSFILEINVYVIENKQLSMEN